MTNDQLDAIRSQFGKKAAKYLASKHRGGSSGKKGSRYEDLFLTCKIVELAAQVIERGGPWPVVRGQIFAFVDDVVVATVEKTEYYQLKNAKCVSWSGGTHPISADFDMQFRLSQRTGDADPWTRLVVPDRVLMEKLRATIPAGIVLHTTVEFFPYIESLNRLVLEYPELHPSLAILSRSPVPNVDELEGVLATVMMGCFQHPNGASIHQILKDACRVVPTLLCAWQITDVAVFVRSDFKSVLDRINGLAYSFDKGFFRWKAYGTSGVFSVDCSTKQFAEFQDSVVQNKPTTFDDFEGLLP